MIYLIPLMRFNASASLSSLQQSEMRIYLFPLLPKMNPGVMNTCASCNTRSVSFSTSAQLSGIFPKGTCLPGSRRKYIPAHA